MCPLDSTFRSISVSKKWKIISIIILLIVSAVIRLHHLDYESLWMDELRQISYYSLPIAQVIQGAAEQSQPPLDYLIGHLVYQLSQTDFAVRLPAALFGVGVVWLITIMVLKICPLPMALLIGLFSALLPFNIYYSQEARPYSIGIFLFLLVLWAFNKSISLDQKRLKNILLLFLFSFLFLFSRALAPLIVISVLILIIIIWIGLAMAREKKIFSDIQQRLVLSLLALLSAFIFYTPCFFYIIKKSGQYLSDRSGFIGFNNLCKGLEKFDPHLVWKIFATQTEPLTFAIACLLLLSPYFAWKMRKRQIDKTYFISLTVLPITLFFHLIIFHGKTDLPFRPPYAIYLLPLSLILTSISMTGIWEISGKNKRRLLGKSVYIACVIFLLFITIKSTWSIKHTRIKADWRAMSNYLNNHSNPKQVFIFKSLKPYGRPTFNGFFRYYKYGNELISMAQLPFLSDDTLMSNKEPVIILFQFREYYLTPDSVYPILPLPASYKTIEVVNLESETLFDVIKFQGFYVITLKLKTGNFSDDTYTLITKINDYMPENSCKIEFHLAAAAIAEAEDKVQWMYHIERAKGLCNKKQIQKVEKITQYIGSMK